MKILYKVIFKFTSDELTIVLLITNITYTYKHPQWKNLRWHKNFLYPVGFFFFFFGEGSASTTLSLSLFFFLLSLSFDVPETKSQLAWLHTANERHDSSTRSQRHSSRFYEPHTALHLDIVSVTPVVTGQEFSSCWSLNYIQKKQSCSTH